MSQGYKINQSIGVSRKSDWPEQMIASIEAARMRPFVWGEHDCCLFSADVVLAMTGADLAEVIRGKYTTEKQALKLIKKQSIESYLDERLPVKDKRFTSRGDLVMVDGGMGNALGICVGAKIAVLELSGLTFVGFDKYIKSWEI